MEDYREFEGKSTEEALAKAQAYYDLPLGRLEVEVVSAGSSGLFGLLGKKAKIRVRVMADSTKDELAALAAVVSEAHRPRTQSPARPQPPEPAPPAPKPAPPEPPVKEPAPVAAPAPSPQPAPAPVAAAPAPVVTPPAPPVAQTPPPVQAPAEPMEEEVMGLEDEAVEEGDEPAEDLNAAEDDEEFEEAGQAPRVEDAAMVELAREVLARLVGPLDPNATVESDLDENGILLQVNTQEAGTIIGRRGQNLEALQYLATRIVSHKAGRPVRLTVDAGGYRGRRREALEELARKAAAKARSGGRPVAVGPLSSPERRVVHLTLRNEPGVTTSSRGRGEMKKVIVSAR